MNKNILYYFAFLCSGLLLSAPLSAEEYDDYIEGPKWKEATVTIPSFPVRDDVIKIEVDSVDMPFSFYVDPRSLSIGDDGVSRYTIIIESHSGASNVMYEGIRCDTNEYRTYAYGTHDGKFSKALSESWNKISSSGAMAHRYNLKRYYLCSAIDRPFSVSETLQRIRYPEEFSNRGGW
ncbi:MAG: hypothetical protein HKM22_04015 [Gammaproteobacteria bacterium]|nr:hypothetical protein [Gammaproteobacteria bacterium]